MPKKEASETEIKKAIIDFTGLLDSSSVQTSKKTESCIVITKISGVVMPGMFKDYSKKLEDMITDGCSWQSIKTGRQANYWIIRLMVTAGDVICEIPGCVIEDIAIKRGKEGVITTSLKLRHQITEMQHHINSTVSTSIRVQLLIDNNPVDVPESDDAE